MANYRYGRYVYGPDPLALPFDVRGAVDEMGDAILAGANPADALRELLRRGLGDRAGRRGLDDMLRRVRERQREIRGSGRLDGIIEQARALLDTAVGQERAELFPDPSDEARPRPSGSWPSTTGGPPPPARPSTGSGSCCGARCWTASSAACGRS